LGLCDLVVDSLWFAKQSFGTPSGCRTGYGFQADVGEAITQDVPKEVVMALRFQTKLLSPQWP
jgi:hypothetical protein